MDPIRIVTVDDYSVVNELLEDYLLGEPFQIVAHCLTGYRALLRVDTLKPDLVITDVWLPDMSGFELVQHLKRQYPKVKIIAISVQDYVTEASQAGVDAFISKDQLYDNLVPTLRSLFRQRVRGLALPLTTRSGTWEHTGR
jgi:DNA-binding NarL/FixJ family response regulator